MVWARHRSENGRENTSLLLDHIRASLMISGQHSATAEIWNHDLKGGGGGGGDGRWDGGWGTKTQNGADSPTGTNK
jgi:hypothetical protein